MSGEYKIEVIHDDTGKVVKTLTYETKRQREKGYDGLLINMNLGEYTVRTVDPHNR